MWAAVLGIGSLCASAPVNPSTPITAQVGQPVAVAFDANPTTGDSWSIVDGPDPARRHPLGGENIRDSDLIGAPGRQCFVFQAVGSGGTTVDFNYARPFEPERPAGRTANVTIVVSAPARVPVQLPLGEP